MGMTGPMGFRGPLGTPGPMGFQGLVGGPTGATGSTGETGLIGAVDFTRDYVRRCITHGIVSVPHNLINMVESDSFNELLDYFATSNDRLPCVLLDFAKSKEMMTFLSMYQFSCTSQGNLVKDILGIECSYDLDKAIEGGNATFVRTVLRKKFSVDLTAKHWSHVLVQDFITRCFNDFYAHMIESVLQVVFPVCLCNEVIQYAALEWLDASQLLKQTSLN